MLITDVLYQGRMSALPLKKRSALGQGPLHELPLFQALEEGGRGHGLAFGPHELFVTRITSKRFKIYVEQQAPIEWVANRVSLC